WPGCTAPVAWTEGHHIKWVTRDRGRTDIDNGVLLCRFHHHLIHATDEWEIRRHKGSPHLVPKRWRGDPLPRHRMQRHRIHTTDSPPGRA
ncbi:MAG: HNH endonuclease, partial [Amnibacterium sp.]